MYCSQVESINRKSINSILNKILNIIISAESRPGRFSEICTTTSSYTAQRSDELSFEAGADIYIILQNGGGW